MKKLNENVHGTRTTTTTAHAGGDLVLPAALAGLRVMNNTTRNGPTAADLKAEVAQIFASAVRGIEGKVDTLQAKLEDAIKNGEKERDEIAERIDRYMVSGGAVDPKKKSELPAFNNLLKSIGRNAIHQDQFDAYRKGMNAYLRYGANGVPVEFANAMSVGSDSKGGYFVLPDTTGQVAQKIYETSPMRQVASVQTISTDALEGLIDNDELESTWVAEQTGRPATNTPGVGKWRIALHEQYAMPEVTQQLLDDASVNVEQWLAGKIADKLARSENTAFVLGNGSGKPRGFLDYSKVTTDDGARAWDALQYIPTGKADGFLAATSSVSPADVLLDTVYSLKNVYASGAVWMMRRSTASVIRKFKDTEGRFIWQESMQAGQPPQLLGYPVVLAEDMPAIAPGAFPIAFGNFAQGYQIVDHAGLRVLRDPFTNKPFVRFYTTRRVGGGLINGEAIRVIKIGVN